MWQTKLAEGSKSLVLTVWTDRTQLLTVEQASQLTLPEFGNLWRVSLQAIFYMASSTVAWQWEKLDLTLCAKVATHCTLKHNTHCALEYNVGVGAPVSNPCLLCATGLCSEAGQLLDSR